MLAIPQNVRHAARALGRSALTSSFIVATLAICIAAVAVVYSIVDVALLRALPFSRPEQLLWVSSVSRDRPDRPFSLPELMDYRAATTTIRLAGFTRWSGILEATSGAERLQGIRMSADGLQILGATPTVGRLLEARDDERGAPRVLVLSHAYWTRSFAGDPHIVGRSLIISGERVTVAGVLPKYFPLPVSDIDVVVPLDPEGDLRRHARGSVNFLRVVGRLEAGRTVVSADRELNTIAARLRAQFPNEYGAKVGVRTTDLRDYLAATQRPTLMILFGAVVLMLIVAITNVVNLLLARAVVRQGETAVRLALGASPRHIAGQLLTEAALLVFIAGGAGLTLASLGIRLAARYLASVTPRADELQVSSGVISVVAGVCSLSVIVFSVVPIFISRATTAQAALRSAGRSGAGSRRDARLRSIFVVGQIALAVVVASAATALVTSLVRLQHVDLGYRPDSVFLARLALPSNRYATTGDVSRFSNALTTALLRTPAVSEAGVSSVVPLSGLLSSVPFAPAHSVPATRRDWPSATYRAVSPGYLTALGARRVAGRLIAEQDDANAAPVAVVNRTLASTYFANVEPIGRQLLVNDNNSGPRAVTIVGVVDDLRETDLDGPAHPDLYLSIAQAHPDGLSLLTATQFWVVRVHADASAFGAQFMRALRDVDPGVATARVTTLRRYVDEAIAPRRLSARLLAAFTGTSLFLTMFGVYGITAYSVEQRRREIGIRAALGATPGAISRLILMTTTRLTVVGVAMGLVGAFFAGGFLSRLAFGVDVSRPAILATVSIAFFATSLLASWLPSRRAARMDTLRALSLG